jgi:hypothetical protein
VKRSFSRMTYALSGSNRNKPTNQRPCEGPKNRSKCFKDSLLQNKSEKCTTHRRMIVCVGRIRKSTNANKMCWWRKMMYNVFYRIRMNDLQTWQNVVLSALVLVPETVAPYWVRRYCSPFYRNLNTRKYAQPSQNSAFIIKQRCKFVFKVKRPGIGTS